MNKREQLKIKAALALIHDNGHDTSAITGTVEKILGDGTPTTMAYKAAFKQFLRGAPEMQASLMRMEQLVDASDTRTVAGYHHAVSNYIKTGDASHMDAVLPTLRADMAAMAERTGDAGFVEGLGAGEGEQAPAQPTEALEGAPEARPGWSPIGYQSKAAKASNEAATAE